jgi:heptosyltransferase-3
VAPIVPGRGRLWRASFTHFVSEPRAGGRHMVERNLDALRRIGIYPEVDERRLTLVAGAAAEEKVFALLAAHGLQAGGFVQVHPSSRWRFKCWPAEKTAALIDRLHAEGLRVVMTAAPEPAEIRMVDDILQRLVRPVAANLSGQLSLKELAALTARARLFMGVDSAPMHIAAAVGTPVLAIFGPSGEALWGPWGAPRAGSHRVVAADGYTCRPCGLDGCGGGKVSDCLVTLEVERVWAAAARLL